MASTASLTEFAATAGEAHRLVVQSLLRGAKAKTRPALPSSEKLLTQLRDAAKLPKKDFDQLNQIVTLATGKSTRPLAETIAQIQQIDAVLQRKPAAVHPLVLTISGIANDSATTALAMPTATKNGHKSKSQVSKVIDAAKVIAADVAGALIGGYLAAKAGKTVNLVIQVAITAGAIASSEVGSGEDFPNFTVE